MTHDISWPFHNFPPLDLTPLQSGLWGRSRSWNWDGRFARIWKWKKMEKMWTGQLHTWIVVDWYASGGMKTAIFFRIYWPALGTLHLRIWLRWIPASCPDWPLIKWFGLCRGWGTGAGMWIASREQGQSCQLHQPFCLYCYWDVPPTGPMDGRNEAACWYPWLLTTTSIKKSSTPQMSQKDSISINKQNRWLDHFSEKYLRRMLFDLFCAWKYGHTVL